MIWKTPEFKVGLFVLVVFSLVGFLSVKISKTSGSFLGGNNYWFEINDSTGLVVNGAVRMAGVKVGIIEKIRLVRETGVARVDFSIESDIKMTQSAGVHVLSIGVLGDKHIQLAIGDISDPLLEPGSQIRVLSSGSSLNNFINKVGSSVDSLSKSIRVFEEALTEGSNKTTVGRIFSNIEEATKGISDMTSENQNKISNIVDNLTEITEGLKSVINTESGERFEEKYNTFLKGLSDVSETLVNLQEITGKINNGEGTIGKLVNDEEVLNQVNELVSKMSTVISDFTNYETVLDVNAHYGLKTKTFSKELSMVFRPGLDREYEFGVVDDAQGSSVITETYTTSEDGVTEQSNRLGESGEFDYEQQTVYSRRSLKYRILYGKRYYNLLIKGGIIHSSGGLAMDYYLFNDRLKLSAEMYNFKDFRLRYFFRYHFISGVYFTGGTYMGLKSKFQNNYIGLGVNINNQDLKILATKASF